MVEHLKHLCDLKKKRRFLLTNIIDPQHKNARPDLMLTEDGKVWVQDSSDPDGFDLLETIRDLQERVKALENK